MRLPIRLPAAIALLTTAAPALAHPGHDHAQGLLAGFVHPFTGYDHIAAMMLVGIWAARAMPKALWVLPASFMTAMAAGFVLGELGMILPAETIVMLSLPALLAGAIAGVRVPAPAAVAIVGLFAIGHGLSHSAEASGSDLGFAIGMLVATALLHAAGLMLGLWLAKTQAASQPR